MNTQQIVIELGVNWAVFGIVFVSLILIGFGYNALVNVLGRRKEGYTSLLVVGGVLFTLAGAALVIGIVNALIVLALFTASGVPMVIGEITRVIRARSKVYEDAERAAWLPSPNP